MKKQLRVIAIGFGLTLGMASAAWAQASSSGAGGPAGSGANTPPAGPSGTMKSQAPTPSKEGKQKDASPAAPNAGIKQEK